MQNKKHLATITILVKDRKMRVQDINKILTENGNMIIARLGVNVQRTCISHCTGMIAIAVEGTSREINSLTKKIDQLYGIVAKSNIMTK